MKALLRLYKGSIKALHDLSEDSGDRLLRVADILAKELWPLLFFLIDATNLRQYAKYYARQPQ
jgi:hypothetical protein